MRKRRIQSKLSVDDERMERFLREYFLDPLTSLADHNQFKIDIYETENDWIVEAYMNDFSSSEITVKITGNRLIINAQKHSYTNPSPFPQRNRTIDFPFPIIDHCVTASFENEVLEIVISKTNAGQGKDRYITLP
ncbi:Hsp20/alpha crystallin family protein [Neobacillus dielmonensis]|uniref:Hsp20/alpha crystallin family protein n=1 Tax=Neobacillus dielmonensis TaxID=1347369 RepID=UPI0005A837C3|nr:Hsp20/alpha crystallin family protein [Neobacillus dielmonensis]